MLTALLVALNVLLRTYASLYMIIPDCDETFNYWEPLNFLLRGFGKRTWEYSPEFAIRSYAYLVPFVAADLPFKMLIESLHLPAYMNFYFIRFLLNGFTMFSELKLFFSIKNRTVAKWYLFFSSVATGMAHAGVALLPSTLAMQCTALALSAGLNDKPVETFLWFLIGGLGGWPFALALAVPYGLYILFTSGGRLVQIVLGTLVNLVFVGGSILTVDYFFYKKLEFVPLNIVLYNVFGGEGEGPEIFGVEDLSYYILNLLLNFNVLAVLGYLGVLFVRFDKTYLLINGPLVIWTAIFFSQPHKEERFLYPIYPLLLTNAAFAVTKIFNILGQIVPSKPLIRLSKAVLIIGTATICVLRTVNLVENYSAPITVLSHINKVHHPNDTVNVCVGREWYHFPNSLFLPDNYRLRFVRSGFNGLLPGEFESANFDIFDITSSIDNDMNNKNIFAESTVVAFDDCDYYIDSSGPTNGEEPLLIVAEQPVSVKEGWAVENCAKIIDPNGAHGLGRYVYVPQMLRGIIPYNVEYRQFCVVRKTI